MIAVLFSGGVDSLCCLKWAQEEFSQYNVKPIYFDVGQCYAKREIAYAAPLASANGVYELQTIPLTSLKEDRHTGHIPMRNLFFLLQVAASVNPEYEGVVFGMLKAESSEDKNPAFVRCVQKLIDSQNVSTMYRPEGKQFTIYTPFANKTKTQMIQWYLQSDYSAAELYYSVACYSEDGACGTCQSCFNRWLAFDRNGLMAEAFKVHPAKFMLDRLEKMHYNNDSPDWNAVSLGQVWKRRRWAWEVYRALNKYSIKENGISALNYIW
jgi:7-cyano-7-deazaguanine synthase in queuosine biosynthesis